METLYGKEVADMLTLIEYQELETENQEISSGDYPQDTHLKLSLQGRNPDDGMTSIAYVKGAFFLMTLEEVVGRKKFDQFLRNYFDSHQFETLTTEEFVKYLKKELLQPNQINFNTDEWIYGPGIPANCKEITSTRFEKVNQLASQFNKGKSAGSLGIQRADWTTQEWMNFIRQLPNTISPSRLAELDRVFDFKGWGNAEIMAEWFVKGIRAGYSDIRPQMKDFLMTVGRRKFVGPIYSALAETPENKKWAKEVYQTARNNYHSVTFSTIDLILQ
jgi:leukotriene-A4 hydrolase